MWLTTRERGRESLNQSFISRREDWNGLQVGGVGGGGGVKETEGGYRTDRLCTVLHVAGSHGLIINEDTKTKCRLYWCFIEFIDWRPSVMLALSTQLCELLPL